MRLQPFGGPWILRFIILWTPPMLVMGLQPNSQGHDTGFFSDITSTSGIKINVTSGHPSLKKLLPEGMSGGVCLFDYDNDGLLDIYFVSGPSAGEPTEEAHRNRLFRNKGNETFEDVTSKSGTTGAGWGMGCSVADFDNDGFEDLYVTSYGSNILYRNHQDGTFVDVSQVSRTNHSGWSTGSAWLDYNNDGLLDLYVANYVTPSSVIESREKTCHYLGFQVMCGPKGLEPEADVFYRNNGNGTFTDVTVDAGFKVTPQFGLGVATLDYDNDGKLDLFVANDSSPNFLFHNEGNGKFKEVGLQTSVALNGDGVTQACMGVDVADVNNDGWLDIFVTNFSQDTNTLYKNLSRGLFIDATVEAGFQDSFLPMGWGANFIDYDNDGWKDLVVVNGHLYPELEGGTSELKYRQAAFLYHNQLNGRFRNVSEFLQYGTHVGRGSAIGDLNNDGRWDLVVSNLDSQPKILMNRLKNENHWLAFRLIGTRSNRDAVGSRVTVVTGKTRQISEVRAGASYLSSNDPRLHFGLGSASVVDRIEIRWPSGHLQEITQAPVDRLMVVRESP